MVSLTSMMHSGRNILLWMNLSWHWPVVVRGFTLKFMALLQILKLICLLADDKDLHFKHSGYQAHFTQRMAEVE